MKNHQKLVENVLPKPTETQLNGANLSLLVFYATERPVKLEKLGSYLHDRIIDELKAQRVETVAHYVKILEALASSIPSHLNLFATPALDAFEALMTAGLPELGTQIFSKFAGVAFGSTTLLNALYRDRYDSWLILYYKLAASSLGDEVKRSRARATGLCGLFTIVASLDLDHPDSSLYLAKIVPHVLDNVDAAAPLPPPANATATAMSRDATASDVALAIVQSVSSRTNSANVGWLSVPVLDWFETTAQWRPGSTLPALVIGTIVQSLAPQHVHVLLSDLLVRVDRLGADSGVCGVMLSTIAKVIPLVTTPLGTYAQPLVDIAVARTLATTTLEDTPENVALKAACNELIDSLIANEHLTSNRLTSIADILVRIESSPDMLPASQKALFYIITLLASAKIAAPSALTLAIPPQLASSIISLMADDNDDVRLQAHDLLFQVLAPIAGNPSVSRELGSALLRSFWDAHGRALCTAYSTLMQSNKYSPANAVSILRIVQLMLVHGPSDRVLGHLVPLFAHVQAHLAEGAATGDRKMRAHYVTSVAFIDIVAEAFGSAALAAYSTSLKEQAPPAAIFGGLELRPSASMAKLVKLGSFKHLEKKNEKKEAKLGKQKEGSEPSTPITPLTPSSPAISLATGEIAEISWTRVAEIFTDEPTSSASSLRRPSKAALLEPFLPLTARKSSRTTLHGEGHPESRPASLALPSNNDAEPRKRKTAAGGKVTPSPSVTGLSVMHDGEKKVTSAELKSFLSGEAGSEVSSLAGSVWKEERRKESLAHQLDFVSRSRYVVSDDDETTEDSNDE